jgi:hypothetical protein
MLLHKSLDKGEFDLTEEKKGKVRLPSNATGSLDCSNFIKSGLDCSISTSLLNSQFESRSAIATVLERDAISFSEREKLSGRGEASVARSGSQQSSINKNFAGK